MLSERLLSRVVRFCADSYMKIEPCHEARIPEPEPGQPYMLYMHVPFCERLCPYCSFNRFPHSEERTVRYFKNLRRELMMVKELGYDFDSLYIGGGTPTIMMDELCDTIDLARSEFSIQEVSCETNPNHLTPLYLEQLRGRVDRMSVGVQSFDNDLLKQMDRFEKYGSGEEALERIKVAVPYFKSLNVDMIYNFPAQTEESLRRDLEMILESGTSQTTFYPLMASPSVEKSLARTVGKVDYEREQRFYEIICDTLIGGDNPAFKLGSAWTFNALLKGPQGAKKANVASKVGVNAAGDVLDHDGRVAAREEGQMIDEYIVDYEEYPAIGSGGMTYLGHTQYVNTFSIREYNELIESGSMSIMGKAKFSKANRMRYRFMMQLFGLRLDKRQWERDFGCTVAAGLPVEYLFMKLNGAFAIDDDEQITLTPKGRYLMVVMMRQFFIGVNNLRDQARAALPADERELLFGAGCAME
ncbi:radical SAM protein [Slackia heliotrinireducens]|uniref:radical SAM protein n=1 Tax=Slackia heliotrinireducens TaxID=84110 RepID=UPI0033155BBB